MRACGVKTLRSHGIQESAHLVFFTWSLLNLISDWFSDTLLTIVNALTILGFCFHSKYYPPYLLCLMYIRVTWRSHDQNVRLRRMTCEAAFTKVFPAKKGTKRHTKHLVSVSMSYPRHLDGIPKKWPVSRRLSLICDPFAKRILFQTSGKKNLQV